MDRSFTFTLTHDDYLEFLRFQTVHSKSSRGKRLWIATSVPAVVLCSIIFFKLYTSPLWMAALTLLALVWVLAVSPQIWRDFVHRRINRNSLDTMGVKGFQETSLHFLTDRVLCRDKGEQVIPYRQIRHLLPSDGSLIFFYGDSGALLLPLRLFSGDEDLKAFIREFELLWGRQRKKA